MAQTRHTKTCASKGLTLIIIAEEFVYVACYVRDLSTRSSLEKTGEDGFQLLALAHPELKK